MSTPPNKPAHARRNVGGAMAIGIGIGCALGVALHQLALGIALGAGIGVAIGAGSRYCRHRHDDESN